MTTTTAPNPRRRTFRTVWQVGVGLVAAFPAAWGALEAAGVDMSAEATALAVGIPGAAIVLASAAQNAWDESRGNG